MVRRREGACASARPVSTSWRDEGVWRHPRARGPFPHPDNIPFRATFRMHVRGLSHLHIQQVAPAVDRVRRAKHAEAGTQVGFPIIADPKREIAVAYGMLDPVEKDAAGLPLTARAVFVIHGKKLKLSLLYPARRPAHRVAVLSFCMPLGVSERGAALAARVAHARSSTGRAPFCWSMLQVSLLSDAPPRRAPPKRAGTPN